MRHVLFIYFVTFSFLFVSAQDFVSRFMASHPSDSKLTCITISPKMMNEILELNENVDTTILGMISNLKSMQMLSSNVAAVRYYNDALSLVNKSVGVYEPYFSINNTYENGQIMIRKRFGAIVELIMFSCKSRRFFVINFTGSMNIEFINRLSVLLHQKCS